MRDPRLILTLGLGGVLLFLLGLSLDHTGLRLLSKPLPLIALLLWVRLAPAGSYRRWISLGLLLSLAGDMLLEWPADLFVFGLGAFLLGHLCFLLAYLGDTRRPALPALASAAAFGLGMFGLLAQNGLGPLQLPVALYALTISGMLWRALARLGVPGIARRSAWLGAGGALLFVLSDSLIGINRFVGPFAGADLAIILTYWAGQFGIAASAHTRQG
ncbi:MAG: lysoplasmalogenase [Pseudomonas sp.]|nr:lysoplasmalogenase [Pseudomonas sp.]